MTPPSPTFVCLSFPHPILSPGPGGEALSFSHSVPPPPGMFSHCLRQPGRVESGMEPRLTPAGTGRSRSLFHAAQRLPERAGLGSWQQRWVAPCLGPAAGDRGRACRLGRRNRRTEPLSPPHNSAGQSGEGGTWSHMSALHIAAAPRGPMATCPAMPLKLHRV